MLSVCGNSEMGSVSATGLWQDVKTKRGRDRCLQGTKMSVGDSDGSCLADWVGEGRSVPQLTPGWSGSTCPGPPLCAPASESSWGWVHQLGPNSCAEQSCSTCQSLRQPQAQATVSGRPCHLLGHPCSAAAGSSTHTSSPRRPGQSQAMKGQLPLFLCHSLALPANKTMNLENCLCHTKGKGQCDLHISQAPVLWQRCILARQSRLDRGSRWRITHFSYKNKYVTFKHAATHALCYAFWHYPVVGYIEAGFTKTNKQNDKHKCKNLTFPAPLFISWDDLNKNFATNYSEKTIFVNWFNCVSHQR